MEENLKIFDNITDEDWLNDLYKELLAGSWQFDVTGGSRDNKFPPGSHTDSSYRFWGQSIMRRIGWTDTHLDQPNLGLKLTNFFNWFNQKYLDNSLIAHKCHVNGQTLGQDGGVHEDMGQPDPHSVMLFSNSIWDSKWGGQFEIFDEKKENIIQTVDYFPGRVVVFKGHLAHRGLGPLVPNILRTSVVWKCEKKQKDELGNV